MEASRTVIVVGAGLAGLSCAHQILQLSNQYNVVVLEKMQSAGGNSIKASSGINGAGTPHQEPKLDNPELFYQDTVKSAKGYGKSELAKVLSEKSVEAVNWLEKDFNVDLSTVTRLGGHSVARTHRGGGKLPPGFAIISSLSKPLGDKIKTGCKVTELISSKDPAAPQNTIVTGVKYQTEGDSTVHELTGQVVLASGGFSAAHSMLQKYRPDLDSLPTTNGASTLGEGQLMGSQIDANLVDMDQVQIHPTGFVDPKDPDNPTKFLAGEALRGEGGVLLINGKRFVDELQTRDVVSEAIMKQHKSDPVVLVLGENGYSRINHHVDFYVFKGLMKKGSLDDIKQEFSWSGAEVEIPESEANSETFYYGIVTPVVHFTMGGIDITPKSEVLDKSGNIIQNLYAAGEVSGGVHGANRLGGSSLLECVVFGRVAANSIVSKSASDNHI